MLVEAHHGLGDLSLMLNLMPNHTLASLAQEPNIDADVIQGHLQTHSSLVKVLGCAAGSEPSLWTCPSKAGVIFWNCS